MMEPKLINLHIIRAGCTASCGGYDHSISTSIGCIQRRVIDRIKCVVKVKSAQNYNIFDIEGLEFVKSRLLFCTIWSSRTELRNLPRKQKGNFMEMSDRQMDALASKVATKLFRLLQGGDTGNMKDKVEIPNPSKMCSVKVYNPLTLTIMIARNTYHFFSWDAICYQFA